MHPVALAGLERGKSQKEEHESSIGAAAAIQICRSASANRDNGDAGVAALSLAAVRNEAAGDRHEPDVNFLPVAIETKAAWPPFRAALIAIPPL